MISESREGRPDSAQATPDVRGYLDGVVAGEATGWCCQPSDLSVRLEVEVIVNGANVANGLADRRRDNLARAGYGDGRYGFRVPLPDSLDDGATHRIAVRVPGAILPAAGEFLSKPAPSGEGDGEGDPPWTMTTFIPDAEVVPGAAPGRKAPEAGLREDGRAGKRTIGHVPDRSEAEAASDGGVIGYVEGVMGGALVGWAFDPAHPGSPVPLTATVDGEVVGDVVANAVRDDLHHAGYGARHGFEVRLGPLEPGLHMVEVRTVDGGARIPLVKDSAVLDTDSEPLPGVRLLDAGGSALPAPAPSKYALLGLDGWLFEWDDPNFHVLRGAAEIPTQTFEHHLARLRERHHLAEGIGAAMVEAVIPSKLAIYREHLPTGLEVDDARRPVEVFAGDVRESNLSDVLDLTAPLRQAKHFGDVFPRTARALGWLGAFAAYRAIAKELALLRGGVVPLLRDQLTFGEIEPVADSLGDLPRVVWMGANTLPAASGAGGEDYEGQPRLDFSRLTSEYVVLPAELAEHAGATAALLQARSPDRSGDALIVHDGSGERIVPLIAEHFARTLVLGAGAELGRVVSAFKPVAIIELIAEPTLLRR